MNTSVTNQFNEIAGRRQVDMAEDLSFREMSHTWMARSFQHRYGYNFTWGGQPLLKYPQDIMMLQMLIHRIRPTVILECGVAFGGCLMFLSDMQRLFDINGRVIGIEQNVLTETWQATGSYRENGRISLIEADSALPSTLTRVEEMIPGGATVLVILDSDHSRDHVLTELKLYSGLVTPGSYLVVFDTFIEHIGCEIADRSFGPGNSPMNAVDEFMKSNQDFEIDTAIDQKLLISEAPSGYLRRLGTESA